MTFVMYSDNVLIFFDGVGINLKTDSDDERCLGNQCSGSGLVRDPGEQK
jgi:hypothetical protein